MKKRDQIIYIIIQKQFLLMLKCKSLDHQIWSGISGQFSKHTTRYMHKMEIVMQKIHRITCCRILFTKL